MPVDEEVVIGAIRVLADTQLQQRRVLQRRKAKGEIAADGLECGGSVIHIQIVVVARWFLVAAEDGSQRRLLHRYVQLCSHLLREFVNCTHLAFGGSLKIGRLQRHLAREQQCGHSSLQFTSKGLLRALAS
jgi:hypothetical protein